MGVLNYEKEKNLQMSLDEGGRAHQDGNNDTDVQSKGRGKGIHL